ncbi:MAG: alanine dehydrogenase [Proteobacteria bacterium]|nr:alanine dehydrogenase [Pseudomonadota bacterium]
MLIGVPKEIKAQENRVGLNPASVAECVHQGHKVLVQSGAGQGILASDDDYRAAGAEIVDSANAVFAKADMIVKVKEPQEPEWKQLRRGQVLFTYLHLAPDPKQAKGLMDSGCTAIAYETVTSAKGGLPLLAPMSEIAGRMAPIMGATALQKHRGGLGRLISGVPGVEPAHVTVLGGGVSGFNAARIAVGMGADVTILEKNGERIRFLDEFFGASARVLAVSKAAIDAEVAKADMVIGAVLVPGANAPRLVSRAQLNTMKQGAVVVDIAIDQGGCFETSKITTHQEPTYEVDGIIHYCVANMPGAYPQSSTAALNNATLPFVLALASKGWKQALADDPHLAMGLNVHEGKIMHPAVAEALGQPYMPRAA